MEWRIIDGIGPFFQANQGKQRINWSKIPFADLEQGNRIDSGLKKSITADFERLIDRVSALGFNAVTLDDVAHILPVPAYPESLSQKIAYYRDFYSNLFSIAAERQIAVLMTTDVMFYNDVLRSMIGKRVPNVAAFLKEELNNLFREFPSIAGIVTRIGESDGLDVKGDFHSELIIRTPHQARVLLKSLLPVFESNGRTWIFRTWGVGAYAIGDLMWNRVTFERTFRGINSPNLIVSHKYGESDFFRYLPLNKQLLRGGCRKIIELQARREYEGFGEYPSFIGWDYEIYARQLRNRSDIAGFSVWCQTGGWTSFRRRTFLDTNAIWNELNTQVTIDIFKRGWTVETSVAQWLETWYPHIPAKQFLVFLRLSDEVIKELLYIDQFSQRKLFFRRVRVPPLLWVYWDHIIINHSMRKMLRCFVTDGEAKVLQGRMALAKITDMREMAENWGLPARDLQFQYDTFKILAAARAYYFQEFNPEIIRKIKELTKEYRQTYSSRYAIRLNAKPMPLSRRLFKRGLRIILRDQRRYRVLDHLLTIRILAWFYPLLRRFSQNRLPTTFADQQAMGIDTVFR